MYAAFGNKEDLFRKALERCATTPAAYTMRALEEPTARAVAAAFLHGAVATTTGPDRPSECRPPDENRDGGNGGCRQRAAAGSWSVRFR